MPQPDAEPIAGHANVGSRSLTRPGGALLGAVLALAFGVVAEAAADDAQGGISGPLPLLMQVAAAGKLHFSARGDGCAGIAARCEKPSYLLPGDSVVVTSLDGQWADAVFTGGPPKFRRTEGWLPRAALRPVPIGHLRPADWYGHWHSGDQQDIDIAPVHGNLVRVRGLATWGGDDPARIADGDVNLGAFDTTLPLTAATMVFAPALNGGPAVLNPQDPSACVIHMHLLGSYLLASGNTNCGGANVTFDGAYRRAPPA